MPHRPLILIVGVCASGKTTLSSGLRRLGYYVRSFAQEHSVSGRLWQRYKPDVLILLNCSYETITQRKRISWGPKRYQQQQELLANAREHATLIIETDGFTPEELVEHVHERLLELGIKPL
ncbi:MAG: hypothetical protein GX956_04105 [Firmicutes bacterium]|nr:hypothetical protein [Bacillota bacterium]